MAVARLKKIYIYSLTSQKEKLLTYLQQVSCVHIIKTDYKDPALSFAAKGNTQELDLELAGIKDTIDLLTAVEGKRSFFETIFKSKQEIKNKDFDSIINSYDYKSNLTQINSLKERTKDLNLAKQKLYDESRRLLNFRDLTIAVEELAPTKRTYCLVGRLQKKGIKNFVSELNNMKLGYHIEIISEDKKTAFLLFLYLKADTEKIDSLIKKYDFEFAQLPIKRGTVSQRLSEIKNEFSQIEKDTVRIEKNLNSYSIQKANLEVIYDYFYNIRKKQTVEENFANTQRTFIMEGWINSKDIKRITQGLEAKFEGVAVITTEPLPGEDVPVLLENRPIFRPFEVVTKLYGQPKYTGLDPTGFLAPFFALSFALCLTDAGYGLILTLISFFILKRFNLSSEAKKFFNLFLLAGIFTVLAGAAVGSWFGNIFDKIKPLAGVKHTLMVFDPTKEPIKFLMLALAVGFVQIAFGVLLNFLKHLKDREYFSAIFSQLPTLVIQIDLFLLVLGFVGIVPKTMIFSLWLIFGFSSSLVIFYNWRTNKDLGLRLFWCIFSIYSIITGNFLADTLSFSRLFALGLTTGLLATAINEIVFLIPGILGSLKMPFLISVFISIIIFVFGHVANLAINVLGAYVHTSRLQYLEFFTKFFEPGGRPFSPFKKEHLYTQIVE